MADPANGVNRDAAGADPARPHSFEKLVPGYGLNRDPERTPMRWDGGPHGGFTTGEPHLPMGDDVQVRNVMALKEDQRSLLWLYRRLMALRRATPALTAGDYRPLRSHNDILRFERGLRGKRVLVALNTSHQPRRLEIAGTANLLLSTNLDRDGETLLGATMLRADEGVILELDA